MSNESKAFNIAALEYPAGYDRDRLYEKVLKVLEEQHKEREKKKVPVPVPHVPQLPPPPVRGVLENAGIGAAIDQMSTHISTVISSAHVNVRDFGERGFNIIWHPLAGTVKSATLVSIVGHGETLSAALEDLLTHVHNQAYTEGRYYAKKQVLEGISEFLDSNNS